MTKREVNRILRLGEQVQDAIDKNRVIRFDYKGVERVVLPQAWGESKDGTLFFRGPQLLKGGGDPSTLTSTTRGATVDAHGVAWRNYRFVDIEGDIETLDLTGSA